MASHSLEPYSSELLYKGLALVTPGGDLVYAIDLSKQQHWHAQLCAVLQQRLHLPEVPLFLTPAYTATVDRWIDARSQKLCTVAEASPAVWRYRIFLQAIFDVPINQWRQVSAPGHDLGVAQSYRAQFPQLWQSHNLVVRVDDRRQSAVLPAQPLGETAYVLHLFIANYGRNTAQTLEVLYQVLEQALTCPYTLKIVDVTQRPDQAEAAQVLATPTLLRVWPQPMRQLSGQLDQARILKLLTL